jgi:hypothetical protein
MLPPLPEKAVSVTYNPLRTRAYFLAALTPGERRSFLEDALRKLEDEILHVKEYCNAYLREEDLFSYMASKGALFTLRAQVDWLRELSNKAEIFAP